MEEAVDHRLQLLVLQELELEPKTQVAQGLKPRVAEQPQRWLLAWHLCQR